MTSHETSSPTFTGLEMFAEFITQATGISLQRMRGRQHGVSDLNASKAAQDDYRRMAKDMGYEDSWKSIGQIARELLEKMGQGNG